MVLVLLVNRCGCEGRQKGALRLGMIEPQTVDKKVNRLPQVVACFLRESDDERDSRVDAIAVGRRDP